MFVSLFEFLACVLVLRFDDCSGSDGRNDAIMVESYTSNTQKSRTETP